MKKRTIVSILSLLIVLVCFIPAYADSTLIYCTEDVYDNDSLLEAYFRNYAALEFQYGEYFVEWPIVAKHTLLLKMKETGLVSRSSSKETEDSLSEEQIDQFVLGYYRDGSSLNLFNIMKTELGQLNAWSYKYKALYSELLIQYEKHKSDWPIYIEPSETDFSDQELLQIAKKLLCDRYEYNVEFFDEHLFTIEFYIPSKHSILAPVATTTEPIWRIDLHAKDGTNQFIVILNRKGTLLASKTPESSYVFYTNTSDVSNATIISPSNHDVALEEAVQIASMGLQNNYDLSEIDINRLLVEAHFLYSPLFNDGIEPVWHIVFSKEEEKLYKALVAYDGNLIDVAAYDADFDQTYRDGFFDIPFNVDFETLHFWDMSHEERAAFSEKWIPLVEKYIVDFPYAQKSLGYFYYATRCVYGIPANDMLSQRQAEEIVKSSLVSLNYHVDSTSFIGADILFDISSYPNPVWKISVYDLKTSDQQKERVRFVIDAISGAVISSKQLTTEHISEFRF